MTSPATPFVVCVSVPREDASAALAQLGEEGLRDGRYRAHQAGGRVLIPVRDAEGALALLDDAHLVETEAEHDPRRPPIDVVREQLADRLGDAQLQALPEGWAKLGDVLLLRLPEELEPEADAIGRAYGHALDARSVIHVEGSTGAWREPEARLLWGEPDTQTVHREHGIAYRLDPREVMFSPGNKTERHRLREHVQEDETVVDLFAGIGYFTLPLAQEGARVIACEANPASAGYLRENAELNELADRIEVREGDCRREAPAGVADRVLMGYLPGTAGFLPTAVDALGPQGGWIHYHDAVARPDALEDAAQRVREHEAMASLHVEVEQARIVKTLDPRRVHVVLDARIERS